MNPQTELITRADAGAPPPTLAWHNNPDIRHDALTRLKEHHANDTITRGVYQRTDPTAALGYRGCAIGCLLPHNPNHALSPNYPHRNDDDNPDWHGQVETTFGITAAVANLIDTLFESVPAHAAPDFALNVAEAIPTGADLTHIPDLVTIDVLDHLTSKYVDNPDHDHHTRRYYNAFRDAHANVADLYRQRVNGNPPTTDQWLAAALDATTNAPATPAARTALIESEGQHSFHPAHLSDLLDNDYIPYVAGRLIHHLTNAPTP